MYIFQDKLIPLYGNNPKPASDGIAVKEAIQNITIELNEVSSHFQYIFRLFNDFSKFHLIPLYGNNPRLL